MSRDHGFLGAVLLAFALPFLGVLALAHCGAGNPMTPQDSTIVTSETLQDAECVRLNAHDAGPMRACRAAVRARFDAYWSNYFDGGAQ